MSGPQIDRTAWPWCHAPSDVEDYDAASWHALRYSSEIRGGPVLPVQGLKRWTLEQRARRSRDVRQPPALSEDEHRQLLRDLTAFWAEARPEPIPAPERDRRVSTDGPGVHWDAGRLVGGVA